MKRVLILCIAGFSWFSAQGQSFQNLGFESATIVPVSGSTWAQWNPAMPGWTGYLGANAVSSLYYNEGCLSACTSLAIIDQPGFTFGPPLLGQYSAIISAGPYMGGPYQASIAQTGLIPADAQSIRFFGLFNGFSEVIPSPDQLIVSVGGQSLTLHSFVLDSVGRQYRAYVADVSAFAGQTAELRFTVATEPPPIPGQAGRGSHLMLDSISFSATRVPEPAIGVLLVVGCAFCGWKPRSGRLHAR